MAEDINSSNFVVSGAKQAVEAGVAKGLFMHGEMQYMPLSVNEQYVSNSITPSQVEGGEYLFYLTFHVVRRAMVYSKSPDTFTRRLLGVICNGISEVSMVQPVLPYLLTAIVIIALCKLCSPRVCGLFVISLLATILSGFDMFFCLTSFTHYLLYFRLIGSQGDKASNRLRREAMWFRYISWGHLLETAYTFLEPQELESLPPIIVKGVLLMAVSSKAFTSSGDFTAVVFPYGWVSHPMIWDHFGFLLLLLSPGFDQEVGNLITACMHVAAYSIVISGEKGAMGANQ